MTETIRMTAERYDAWAAALPDGAKLVLLAYETRLEVATAHQQTAEARVGAAREALGAARARLMVDYPPPPEPAAP